MQWVELLPDTQTPSWLGLPNNAERVLLTTQGEYPMRLAPSGHQLTLLSQLCSQGQPRDNRKCPQLYLFCSPGPALGTRLDVSAEELVVSGSEII